MNLTLRQVCPGDMDLLYRWANDPVTRHNAFHTEQIPYETHRQWFADVLADPSVVIYICMDGEEAVGQLRFGITDDEALISYSVDAAHRGCGAGTELVRLAGKRLQEEHPQVRTFRAEVKYDNIASLRVFEKNGYTREDQAGHAVFIRKL